MTLVSRNRIILSLFILAVAFILVTGIIFVLALMKGTILFPETTQRLFDLPNVPLLSPNMSAAILSAIVLLLYSAVMLGISLVNFEKTRSLEITCFAFFALGCRNVLQHLFHRDEYGCRYSTFGQTILPATFSLGSYFFLAGLYPW